MNGLDVKTSAALEMKELKEQLEKSRDFFSARRSDWDRRQLGMRLEESQSELIATRTRYSELLTQLQATEEELTSTLTECQMRKELEGVLRAKLESANNVIRRMESALERSNQQNETLRGTPDQRVEIAVLKQQLASAQEQLANGAGRVTNNAWTALERQEQRLRNYAQMLKDYRSEIQRQCRESSELLQSTFQYHPLQDYLKVTEYELSRVEKELKAAPTASPQRPKLQQCFEKMIEQRDFLRSVIDASRELMESQSQKIFKMGSDEAIPPVPPMPPRVARPSDQGDR